MELIRVSSWIELQERLFEGTWQEPLARHRSPFLFRGVPKESHPLETSLQSGGFEEHEARLLSSFRKYALRNPVHDDSVWNWLSLAKHHGLPTRLLDWTYSPYVAMHFATQNMRTFHEDGAVWCVDYRKTNKRLPKPLRELLRHDDSSIFTSDSLNDVATTLKDFDQLGKKHPFILFFEPPSLDERIVNQFALFSLPSSATLHLERYLTKGERLVRKLIIPADLKWEIRDKLDQANITERVLFPGLDGLCAWLKRYFTTREPDGDESDDELASPGSAVNRANRDE